MLPIHRPKFSAALPIVLGTLVLLSASSARASTYTVSSLSDSGSGSLRAAITSANSDPGSTINITAQGSIVEESPLPAITANMTINGPGTEWSYISGNNAYPIFVIDAATVSLNNLYLIDGYNIEDGGSIVNNAGNLTITGTAVSLGATVGAGGGIFNNGGMLTLNNSAVFSNSAAGPGGGIENKNGVLTLLSSNIGGNQANGEGGGIYSFSSNTSNTATITGSGDTINANQLTGEDAQNQGSKGGGIYSTGPLTLTNSAITYNSATIGVGAGIYSGGGGALTGCQINSNTEDGPGVNVNVIGGGLCCDGVNGDALILNGCQVEYNSAPSGSGIAAINGAVMTIGTSTISDNATSVGAGAGVANLSSTLTFASSTISGNVATGNGGGLSNAGGTVSLTNCTIAGNTSSGGGGISSSTATGATTTTTLISCTVTGNTGGTNGGGGLAALGAGTTSFSTRGTLVAGNTNILGPGVDVFTATGLSFTSAGSNLIGDATGSVGFTNGVNHDQVGLAATPINPRLDPQGLAAPNGGPTPTIALLYNSPAVDADFSASPPPTDQRGITRPQGVRADIGAYELIPDTTAPDTSAQIEGIYGGNGWYRTAVSVILTAIDTGGSGVGTTTYNLDGSGNHTYSGATGQVNIAGDGTHTLTYFSTDNAGNVEGVQSLTVKIDTTYPTITFGAPTPTANFRGWHNTPVTLPYVAFDATSGIGSASPGSPLIFSNEGTNQTDTVEVVDNAGNSTSEPSPLVSIDMTPPTTTASGSKVYNGVQITLQATDNLSGVAFTTYTVDNNPAQNYTQPFNVTGTSSHTVTFHSTDNAGNVEAAKTLSINKGVALPVTSAFPNGQGGTNSWYRGEVDVTLTAKSNELPIAKTVYSLDGGALQTYSNPVAITGNGKHTLTYYSVDTGGNAEAPNHLAINIDNTPPVVTAAINGVTNTSGAYIGSAKITITASDSLSGVASTNYSLDGAPYQTYTAPLSVSTTGAHTLSIYSTDVAGNFGYDNIQFSVAAGSVPVAHVFPAGLQLLSVPADYSALPLGTVLSQTNPILAVWSPTANGYKYTPTAPADALRPGVGYWSNFTTSTDLYDLGTPTPTTQPFVITLKPGWNQIGDPFPAAISLSAVTVTSGTATYTGLSTAAAAGVVYSILDSYPAGSTAYQTENATGSLTPYTGYWIYAYTNCELNITSP